MKTEVFLGERLVAQVATANSVWQRLLGLALRPCLPAGHGLWLRPCYAVHTWGMRFAIDAVFLDSKHRVVGILSQVRPWRVCRSFRGTRSVLELPARTADTLGLRVGDLLRFRQL